MPEPVRESQVEVSGHSLMVREAGDLGGTPLIYFHGTPSSRLEPAFADALAAELGIRLVSFDRPGYGESQLVPFSLASIARDTGLVADALGIDGFATNGHSGGGPFSLACGAVLGDRVTRVGVTAGPGPYQEVPGQLDVLDANDRAAVALLPDQAAAASQFGLGFEPFRAVGGASDADFIAGFKSMSSRRDGQILDQPAYGPALAAAMRAALVQGTSCAGWDNVAWVGPWNVDLAAIQQPVFLWYGDEDTFVSPVHGEWLEQTLPTATLVVRAGDGHLGVMEHAREVLETLTAD